MKVLYICQLDKIKSPGIFNKIKSKIKHLNAFLELDTLCITKEKENSPSDINFFVTNKSYLDAACEIIDIKGSKYDVILMRYPRLTKKFKDTLKKHKNKIIFEHNTLELNELRFGITSLSIKDVLYLLGKDIKRFYKGYLHPYFNEIFYAKDVLSNALGGICVSESVNQHEKKRYNNYKTLVQGNGVEVNDIPLIGDELNYKNIELLFISGSSNKWHGIDRLIKGIVEYRGKSKVILHIVGKIHHSIIDKLDQIPAKHNYMLHGILNRDQIALVSKTCNVGVGSLGLHRLGMYQGSTLKIREYMAMGLPFITGYIDIDVPENYPYALCYKPDDSIIDLSLIDDFLLGLKNNNFSRSKMREDSFELIDQHFKMKNIAMFINKLMDEKTS